MPDISKITLPSGDTYDIKDSSAVKSVNNNLPDANGNVTIQTGGSGVPSGGIAGQILIKQSSDDGDVDWENIPSDSTKVSKTGDIMTGQLHTSFLESVAMGSYGSNQTTIPNLVGELRYSSGACGSANITTAYTLNSITVPTGWYNYLWIPHRSGGNSGTADSDNCDYGSLYLSGMTVSGLYMIRYSSGSIAELKNIYAPFTVGNGTLTVQRNGSNVGTFTANQSGNSTINIQCATSDTHGSISTTLLWTNSSPASRFAAQRISLTLTSYYAVDVIYRWYTNQEYYFHGTFPKGTASYRFTTPANQHRGFYADNSGVVVDAGTNSGDSLIPYRVYGIKLT